MFVELTPNVMVDPADVAATTSETATSTRVYLRGSGARNYLLVDLPIADVVARLLTRAPAAPPRERRMGELFPRPSPGRSEF